MTPNGLRLGHGLIHVPGYLGRAEQEQLRDVLRQEAETTPFLRPVMPRTGRPLSVKMMNLGRLGWVTDRERGYRYQTTHPETGKRWGTIPAILLRAWEDLAAYPAPPEACLVNVYASDSKMGLHQDRDEEALDAPVLSLSLGATAVFRIGGTDRADKTRSIRLESGDAFLLGGSSRLVFHGVDRIVPGTSTLLPGDMRVSCTLRRVTPPA